MGSQPNLATMSELVSIYKKFWEPFPQMWGAKNIKFWTTFSGTSALNTVYLRNETSHRQTKTLSINLQWRNYERRGEAIASGRLAQGGALSRWIIFCFATEFQKTDKSKKSKLNDNDESKWQYMLVQFGSCPCFNSATIRPIITYWAGHASFPGRCKDCSRKNSQGVVDGNGFLSAGWGCLGAKCVRRVEEMNGRCLGVGLLTLL